MENIEFAGFPLRVMMEAFSDESSPGLHAHTCGQLVYSGQHAVTVEVSGQLYQVLANAALWLPPGKLHRVFRHGVRQMRNIYIGGAWINQLPVEPSLCQVTDLGAQLILWLAGHPLELIDPLLARALPILLFDQFVPMKITSLRIPQVTHAGLAALIQTLQRDSQLLLTLEEASTLTRQSPRSLERLIQSQMGMTFLELRDHFALQRAQQALLKGRSVQQAAADTGYESPGSLIRLFHRKTGMSPGKWQKLIVEQK